MKFTWYMAGKHKPYYEPPPCVDMWGKPEGGEADDLEMQANGWERVGTVTGANGVVMVTWRRIRG
jgi:hypothetical protein